MAISYRAEVIGSMLRPGYLKDARKKWEAGGISTREFKCIEDRAVDEAIALQERCGVDVITDGEMRRTHFIAPLTDVITGVKPIPAFTRVWKLPHEQSERARETEIQAWVTPPAYTGLAPVFLKRDRASVAVPAGAKLTVS